MIIAREKKEKNIVEYILYMWQIEDIIRSYEFDLDKIETFIIDKFDVDPDTRAEIKLWYKNLLEQLVKEGKAETGHLDSINKYSGQLLKLHYSLLTSLQDKEYKKLYDKAQPNIQALMNRSGGEANDEIQACLNGLYGMLMLRLRGEDISKETRSAVDTFSNLMAYLAQKYNDLRSGKLKLPEEKNN